MNEQLIVKNFGPIKDATVDFKRVTVFIGPTGGGKSTLAKLAAIFRQDYLVAKEYLKDKESAFKELANSFLILDYLKSDGKVNWQGLKRNFRYSTNGLEYEEQNVQIANPHYITEPDSIFSRGIDEAERVVSAMIYYVPADRAFAAALDSGLPGLVLQNVALPDTLLMFLNDFKRAQRHLTLAPLEIPFLDISYQMLNKQVRIVLNNEQLIELGGSASGMQAVIPMMLVISDATKWGRIQVIPSSFIIEEPELNLYPIAQQGLLNWLVEKCTKGENDLTLTTHSPYILSHLNLLLYAYQVAEKHPDRREAVAAIVPEASWINPKEFACYQVENGGVQSLLDEELGLIDNNELDGLSGDAADAFDNLIRLSKGFAIK